MCKAARRWQHKQVADRKQNIYIIFSAPCIAASGFSICCVKCLRARPSLQRAFQLQVPINCGILPLFYIKDGSDALLVALTRRVFPH